MTIPRYEEMSQSPYYKGDDVRGGAITLTIADIAMENSENDETKPPTMKPLVTFKEPNTKQLFLNVENREMLGTLFGHDTSTWIGKRVTLWFNPNVYMMGEKKGGVRLRAPDGYAAPHAVPSMGQSSAKVFAQLIELAGSVGLSADQLKARLTDAGLMGFNLKDEPTVRAIIDAERVRKQQDAATDPVTTGFKTDDDTIPF